MMPEVIRLTDGKGQAVSVELDTDGSLSLSDMSDCVVLTEAQAQQLSEYLTGAWKQDIADLQFEQDMIHESYYRE